MRWDAGAKGRKARRVPITPQLAIAIKRYVARDRMKGDLDVLLVNGAQRRRGRRAGVTPPRVSRAWQLGETLKGGTAQDILGGGVELVTMSRKRPAGLHWGRIICAMRAPVGWVAVAALAGCGAGPGNQSQWSPAPGTLFTWSTGGGQTAALPIAHQAPPVGVAVVWTVGAADPKRLIASDWQGRAVGWMEFAASIRELGEQSPDGSGVEIGNALYSSDGQLIASNLTGGTWADDSRHLCEVLGPNGEAAGHHSVQVSANTTLGVLSPAWLYVSLPGHNRRPIAQVGDFSDHGNISVASCSLTSDEAIVTTSFIVSITRISEYRLSTGKLLYSAELGSSVFGVVATHDGTLIAEDDSACGGTVIRDLAHEDRVVAKLQGAYVKAFSWDGTSVLTNGPMGNPSNLPAIVSVRTLSSGVTVWSAELPPTDVNVEPAGSAFLLGVSPVSPGYEALSESVFVVNPHGAVTHVTVRADMADASGLEQASVGGTSSTGECG